MPDDFTGSPLVAPGVPVGSPIGVVFHLRNASEKPITFISETSRQGDYVHVANERGIKVEVKDVWFSGWPIDVAWKLQPGESAQLSLLTPGLGSFDQPGRHTVRYTVRFTSRIQKDDAGNVIFPRPGDFDKEVETGETPLILSDVKKEIFANGEIQGRLVDDETGEPIRDAIVACGAVNNDCSADLSVIVGGLGTKYSRTTLIYDGYGIEWDNATGEVKRMMTHKNGFYFRDITVSPDGKRFATCNEHGGGVCVWETSTGKLLHDFSDEAHRWKSPNPELVNNNLINSVAFSPDGKQLAVSGTYGVKFKHVESGMLRLTIDAPYGYYNATGIYFSADGLRLGRIGAGGKGRSYTVPIWSTETGCLVTEFELKPDMFGNLPIVTDHSGRRADLVSRPLLGTTEGNYRDTLEPGESFGPLYFNLGLGDNPRPGIVSWEPYWPKPTIGKYNLAHKVAFKVAAPGASSDSSSGDSLNPHVHAWAVSELQIQA